ncbi:right-handed parallel beta-helix repeat-containing protein [Paenibacillus sp. NPDC058071]|uniref:alpha-1,3-galactosidase-related protein n=1 Tax=Paenibacillus sp. NPDC058071 TaxID=3346326 RepID=UPI0036D83C01
MTSTRNNEITELQFDQFGIIPDTGQDAVPAMRQALEAAAAASGPVKLVVRPGRYDFYPEQATRALYYITNTASESENPDVTKTIAVHMKGLTDFTLDGSGALFVFHGKMTMFALDGCERVVIQRLHTDFARPTVTEMTVDEQGEGYADFRVHSDSHYEISGGRLFWTGDGWRFDDGPVQLCDPARNTTWRVDNFVKEADRAEELEPGRIRLYGERLPRLAEGWVVQSRDGIRDQVGMFINRSRDIRLEEVGVHFMHGLGIVGQFSENLTFRRIDLSPRAETGRTAAAFADFVHLSGCKGTVEVDGSRFAGAHDDAINVHGTYLRIIDFPASNQALVRFMHPQTYGFVAFEAGDEIEWVKAHSLVCAGRDRVERAEMIGLRDMLLTFSGNKPDRIKEGDVIENVTWTPEVVVTDNHFARIPTRGVLVTSGRKAVVERNTFERMRMSGVLVAGDAADWFESGPVRDLTVRYNRFIGCGTEELAVISLLSENEEVDERNPVHTGIRILDNRFEMEEATLVLDAKSVKGLTFEGNTVVWGEDRPEREQASKSPDTGTISIATTADAASAKATEAADHSGILSAIRLTACSDVTVADNKVE